MKGALYKFLLPILSGIFGVCLGVLIRDFPKFKLVYDIKVTDAIGNVVTLAVGIFVPLIVKKIIEDARSIKTTLLVEVDGYKNHMDRIFEEFNQCYENGKITQQNKENITNLLDYAETKLGSLSDTLNEHFPKVLDKNLVEVSDFQNRIWKILTGGKLSKSTTKTIDSAIHESANKLNEGLKLCVMKLKTDLHKI